MLVSIHIEILSQAHAPLAELELSQWNWIEGGSSKDSFVGSVLSCDADATRERTRQDGKHFNIQ